jgi:hypothetical protein
MKSKLLAFAVLFFGLFHSAGAYDASDDEGVDYLFAWPFIETSAMSPRGGTTRAPIPEPVDEISDAWRALQEEGLSDLERDRRAILAMAGEYRVSFDFLETVGFEPGFEPARPYRSWGTEFVEVVTDEPEFISLQHVLVMFFENDEGELTGPMVTKHWSQDWHYEDTDVHEYAGNDVWKYRELDAATMKGAWTQAVFQVDDSPRYENYGRWEHHPTHSVWESNRAYRPLPRREWSVRDDYNVLNGINRQTILPSGWVHEQDNLKMRVDEDGAPEADRPFLAREMGVNRYQPVADYDFAAGRRYWEATQGFWAEVRAAWERTYADHRQFELLTEVEGTTMWMALFQLAASIEETGAFDSAASREDIEAIFARHVRPVPVG